MKPTAAKKDERISTAPSRAPFPARPLRSWHHFLDELKQGSRFCVRGIDEWIEVDIIKVAKEKVKYIVTVEQKCKDGTRGRYDVETLKAFLCEETVHKINLERKKEA